MQVFRWHEAAALIGADGAEMRGGAEYAPIVADRPGPVALARALAGNGQAFRIGGAGPLEAGFGAFEALTGGSLGVPRPIVRTHASWIASFAVNAGLFGIGPGVAVAVLGRLSHSLALYGAVEGVCLGARVHLLDTMRADRQAQALAVRGAEVLYATPSQLFGVVAADVRLPALRHVLVGGAALDAGLRARLADLAPNAAVQVFYGAAETSFIAMGRGVGSVGHPYPGVLLRLTDSAGQEADEGEIWVKSPYLFRGYAGADAGAARWDQGWLSVGEVGRMTPSGLQLRGRSGRMVTVADRNVFPEEIEAFLQALPGVARVAVVPRPDPVRGQVLVAVVMGDRGVEASFRAAARAELGPMVAPRAVIWVDAWPELPSGKTDLRTLMAGVARWL